MSYLLRVKSVKEAARMAGNLFVNANRGYDNLVKTAGVWSLERALTTEQLQAADRVFRGGYEYKVTDDDVFVLVQDPLVAGSIELTPLGFTNEVPGYYDSSWIRPNGPLDTTTQSGDSEFDVAFTPQVISRLTFLPNMQPGVSYRIHTHGREIDWVGMSFGFYPGGAGSAIACGVFNNTNLSNDPTLPQFDSAAHLATTKTVIQLAIFQNGVTHFDPVMTFSYPFPLPDFGFWRMDMFIDKINGRAAVYDPFGNRHLVEDQRFRTVSGKLAFYEHVQNSADQAVPFWVDRWAGDSGRTLSS